MTAQWISILVLAALFVLATWRNVHLGAAALAAAWLVGVFVFHVQAPEVLAGFPVDLLVTLVGVTFLFAIAEKAGAINAIVHWAMKLVRGRVSLMPWVVFLITAAVTAVGAATPAAAAIVGPIAMGFARRYQINPVLMGMAVIQGASAGSFAPTGVYGMIINGIVRKNNLVANPMMLFLGSLVAILITVIAAYFAFGGRQLWRHDHDPHAEPVELDQTNWTSPLVTSLLAIAVLVILVGASVVMGFELNIGLTALLLVVVLASIFPDTAKGAVGNVSWPTVLLVCGVVTYVALLQNQGVVDWLGNSVAGIGAPLMAALVICLIGAVVSALASTTGILTALIPLAVPFLATGQVWAAGLITALAISSSVVDCSPFSTNGALMVAYSEEPLRDMAYRKFMTWGWALVILGPLVSWLALVVLPSLF